MFFELRQYRIIPGTRDEWVTFMEERIIPGQFAHRVVVVGSFLGQEDDDLYVWLRRFESEEHFAVFNETYYGSDEWTTELEPRARWSKSAGLDHSVPGAYAAALAVSTDTARRDLQALVHQGVLQAAGTTRDRCYRLASLENPPRRWIMANER